jgi:hypothetical protein
MPNALAHRERPERARSDLAEPHRGRDAVARRVSRFSKWHILFLLRNGDVVFFTIRDALLNCLNEPDCTCYMVKNQEALIVVQNLIVMSEALFVPYSIHIEESLQVSLFNVG